MSSRSTFPRRPSGGVTRGAPAAALIALLAPMLLPAAALAVQVTIPANRDNTLYQPVSGSPSNGAGEYMFTGRNKDGFRRRTVIAFDVAGTIPAGSTINSATLQLHVSRVANNTLRPTTAYRLLADWGEGTSNATQNEGQGTTPTTNDATWLHRFYPGTLWTTAGGDYSGTAVATTLISGTGTYTWAGAPVTSDVQFWLDSPSNNFGWILLGDESVVETAKRLDSRQNGQTANRPALIVDYTPPGGTLTGACCHDGTCDVVTAAVCAGLSGTYQGDNTTCTPSPCGGGGTVNVTVNATHDNTLYQDATGSLSNGLGTKLLASKNGAGVLRRGVVRFDLSGIPAGATIQSATVQLYNVEVSNSANVTLHRVSASWGEGTSVATGNEDAGAASTTGDATWVHRSYPSTTWTAVGGDFNATESALTAVVGAGLYAWTSATLAADVQAWVDAPSSNYGWIIRGKESGAGNALKRFESRQSADVAHRPALQITYQTPVVVATGACCLPSGLCDTLSLAACTAAGGTYQGDNTTCSPNPCPVVLTPFVDPLPIPAVAVPVVGQPGGAAEYVIPIREVSQQLHRDLPPTRVWGYAGSYPGPTILATRDLPIQVTWWNDLRDEGGNLRTSHFLPVDLCLKGPDEAGATARVVTHLHGGHVPSASDGYPDSTLLPGEQRTIFYPNHQPPGTLWYHDHAMGITRLNVMMGLAGFWLLSDATEAALGLPSGEFEIGLAIQDRSFHPDGSLSYPENWVEHFEGDKMLVNGKVWPYLQVKRGKYRFRMLNGCNSRFLRLSLSNGAPITVIGNDLGLLTAPVARETLLIANGERFDVVIDFSAYSPGTQIVLTNDAPAMFPGTPGEGVIPNVMRFDVVSASGHTAPLPATLRTVTPIDTAEAVVTRDLALKKSSNPCTGTIWTINDLGFDDLTEYPVLGTTEIWRFINDSGVSHPMHLHLVQFQVVDRQPFTRVGGQIVPLGPPVPPPAGEEGWKDTAPVGPNEILRVIARFEDYAGLYPYHCHLLEHEDHEMMRQFQSVEPPVVSIADSVAVEGGVMTFRVRLTAPVPVAVRVFASTENGSAEAGLDYEATTDTLDFVAGQTQQFFAVPLLQDVLEEGAESFAVRLTGRVNVLAGDTVATGAIIDDDGSVAVEDAIPSVSYLGRAAPNPFAHRVALRWGMSSAGDAELSIYDVQGRLIRRLARGEQAPGHKLSVWNGLDEHGTLAPAGLYLVRLRIGGTLFRGSLLRLR